MDAISAQNAQVILAVRHLQASWLWYCLLWRLQGPLYVSACLWSTYSSGRRSLNSDLFVSSTKSKTLNNLCTSLNMKQLITLPTRVTETSKTLIDVIFTLNPAITVDSGVVETHISDQYLVFAVLNLRMPKPPAAYGVARSYKHYDPQSFLSDLNKIPWYENILSDDVNEKLLHFNRTFFRVLDNRAPIKKIKIKHRKCPFIN